MNEQKKPNWYPMWEELGIDIQKHDQLLEVLPKKFEDVYIKTQQNRPESMAFWDMVVKDIHGLRINEIKRAKEESDKKVVGTFCLYVPDEILFGLDVIGIGLCGGTNFSNYAAEDLLPTNICPLIKSALGFGIGKICPYFATADLLIGETTCDGKKKAWEILNEYNLVYVMETPQCKERAQAKELYLKELKTLIKKLEDLSNNTLTAKSLKDSMQLISKKREQMRRVYDARKEDPVPISGKDALLVSQVAFYDDPKRQIEMIGNLADELDQRIEKNIGVAKKGTKRILISGTPMAIPNWKIHHLVETKDAVIVAEETCTGTRYFQSEFNGIQGENLDILLEKLVERYLDINCACFTPNNGRKEDIIKLAEEYDVEGIILYTLNFCQPYEFESLSLEKSLKEEGYSVLSIQTDYSGEDTEQLNTRIEAFLEII